MFKFSVSQRALACLLLGISLSGCLGGAFIAGAAATAIVYDRRSMDAMRDDIRISRAAYHQINSNPTLKNHSRIVVASFNHIVLIVGQVPNEQSKIQVQEYVDDIEGVKRIYNELIVSGNVSPLTRSSDSWISAKVKAQMLSTKGLYSSQIKVISENGTVYLMGLVTRRQAQLASDVASRVHGVQRVVKLFEYE